MTTVVFMIVEKGRMITVTIKMPQTTDRILYKTEKKILASAAKFYLN
ncbi:MAG: hypothetical protein Q8K86_11550 [Candidatus Nanopelagicaceae bacterium]|nr:hypothetical protein [Candidatus Nanopelagicaceae bacterium]